MDRTKLPGDTHGKLWGTNMERSKKTRGSETSVSDSYVCVGDRIEMKLKSTKTM